MQSMTSSFQLCSDKMVAEIISRFNHPRVYVFFENETAHFSFSFFTFSGNEIFLLRRSFSIAPATELLTPQTSHHPSTVMSVAFMKTSVHVLFVICFSLHFKLDSLGSNPGGATLTANFGWRCAAKVLEP